MDLSLVVSVPGELQLSRMRFGQTPPPPNFVVFHFLLKWCFVGSLSQFCLPFSEEKRQKLLFVGARQLKKGGQPLLLAEMVFVSPISLFRRVSFDMACQLPLTTL